jgi:hypothetical protein
VWGRSESEDPIFKGIDFAFGRVDPGKERSWVTDVKVPKAMISRWDPLKLELHGDGLPTELKNCDGALAVAAEKPSFAYEYKIKDTNAKNPALSGNGVIDPDDTIELGLQVRNVGNGTSRAAEVNIHGEGGEQIFLQSARQRLANFVPGEKRDAAMSFRFAAPGDDKKVTVVVNLSDTDYGVGLTDEIKLDVGVPYKKSDKREPPTIKVSKSPPLRTTADRIEFDVTAEDDESVKEIYVYSGVKKILYRRNPEENSRKLRTHVVAELQPGSNFLVVAAGDEKGLVNRSTFFVLRPFTGRDAFIGNSEVDIRHDYYAFRIRFHHRAAERREIHVFKPHPRGKARHHLAQAPNHAQPHRRGSEPGGVPARVLRYARRT